jgi:hypothetical protein
MRFNTIGEKNFKKCPEELERMGVRCLDIFGPADGCPKCADGSVPDLYIAEGIKFSDKDPDSTTGFIRRSSAISQCGQLNRSKASSCVFFVYLEDQIQLDLLRSKYRRCFGNVTVDSHGNLMGTELDSLNRYGELLGGTGNLFGKACILGKQEVPGEVPYNVIRFCETAPPGATIAVSETIIKSSASLCPLGNQFACYQCTGTEEFVELPIRLPDCSNVSFGGMVWDNPPSE